SFISLFLLRHSSRPTVLRLRAISSLYVHISSVPIFHSTFRSFHINVFTPTTLSTLSLHDALPISAATWKGRAPWRWNKTLKCPRSEEHTSELQSRFDLVCRLLLEKKKKVVV